MGTDASVIDTAGGAVVIRAIRPACISFRAHRLRPGARPVSALDASALGAIAFDAISFDAISFDATVRRRAGSIGDTVF